MKRMVYVYSWIRMYFDVWKSQGWLRATSMFLAMIPQAVLDWCFKAFLFVRWRLSRVADEETQLRRNEICGACRELDYDRGGPGGAERWFCKACGCPRTATAELHNKNRRVGHNCPLGLHPGSVRLPFAPCSSCNRRAQAAPAADVGLDPGI